MGFQIGKKGLNLFLDSLKNDYDIYAPVVFEGGGTFSDTDCIRYAKINSIDEIEFEKKSNYSFKESILPVNLSTKLPLILNSDKTVLTASSSVNSI